MYNVRSVYKRKWNSLSQRLDLFAWCARLSRLLVGFRTHLKSMHFHFSLVHSRCSIQYSSSFQVYKSGRNFPFLDFREMKSNSSNPWPGGLFLDPKGLPIQISFSALATSAWLFMFKSLAWLNFETELMMAITIMMIMMILIIINYSFTLFI